MDPTCSGQEGRKHAAAESMTGYSARGSNDFGELSIDIASVNHKQARVSLRSEVRDLALEETCAKQIEWAWAAVAFRFRFVFARLTSSAWTYPRWYRSISSYMTLPSRLCSPADT